MSTVIQEETSEAWGCKHMRTSHVSQLHSIGRNQTFNSGKYGADVAMETIGYSGN